MIGWSASVDVKRRTLVQRRLHLRFAGDALAKGLHDTRLADACLPRKQDDLSFTLDRLPPTTGQQVHFLFAADEIREIYHMGGEAARDLPLPDHAPNRPPGLGLPLQPRVFGLLELRRFR